MRASEMPEKYSQLAMESLDYPDSLERPAVCLGNLDCLDFLAFWLVRALVVG